MLKCPFCNFENEDGALFCDQCKSDLGTAQPVAAASNREHVNEALTDTTPLASLPEPAEPVAAVVVEEGSVTEAVPVAEVAVEGHALAAAPAPEAYSLAEPASLAAPEAVPANGSASAATPAGAEAAAPPSESTEPGRLPAGAKPKLVVLRGQRVDAEYPLYDGDNYIGRSDDKAVDVDLEDQEPPDKIWSSRQHALITLENGALAIEDLNSMNGTFVNRMRIHPGQKRPLQVHDVIQIGTVRLEVRV